jgi:multisubunit Na+/H+ antiporter MnhE subunit
MRALSGFIMFNGLVTLVISILQWQVWNNDLSQFLFGFGFFVMIMGFGYLYEIMRNIQDEQQAIGKVTTDLINKIEIQKK